MVKPLGKSHRSPSPGAAAGKRKAAKKAKDAHNDDVSSKSSGGESEEAKQTLGGTDKHEPQLTGVTLDGSTRFPVPDTPTTLEALAKWYTLPSLITAGFFALSIYASLPQNNVWYILSLAIFWRLAYDVGLGLMLHQQSKTAFMTRWVQSVQRRPNSLVHRTVSYVIDTTMGSGHNSLADSKLPAEYSAWILARFVINVVLPNDVLAFCLAAARFADFKSLLSLDSGTSECDWAHNICLSNYIVWPMGIALMITSLMGKVSAHHVIGQFAWFWGDFFFKVDQNLTFDGIFELLPHPMYTVGYGWAYAVGIMSRSYVVLALAMGSHLCQMLFLQFVETPHIEKLYGSESSADARNDEKAAANVFIVKNFDPFRASDVSLVIVVIFQVLAVLLGSWNESSPLASDTFFIAQAIFWRSVASLCLAYVLVRQEKERFWTKHFAKIGSTDLEAFENWKRLFNLLTSLQHVSFLLCAYRLFSAPPLEEMLSGFFAARVIFAIMLWGLTYWSFSSSFDTLGDFGWFYGDFFIDPPQHAKLTYTGIYRYINNPDVYLGHVWMYAVAILCSSWELMVVGFAAQSAHVVFLQLVEKPHLRAIYANKVRPHSTAMEGVIKRKVGELKEKLVKRMVETTKENESMRNLVKGFLSVDYDLTENDHLEVNSGAEDDYGDE